MVYLTLPKRAPAGLGCGARLPPITVHGLLSGGSPRLSARRRRRNRGMTSREGRDDMADDQKDLVALNAARRALGGGGDSPLPAGAGSLQRQADQLAGMGDWGPSAEDVNRRLLEMDPQRKVAMTRLARCLREKGDAEAAEALYVEILAVDPANMIASNFLRGLRLK